MDYKSLLQDYHLSLSGAQIEQIIANSKAKAETLMTEQVYKTCFACMDLTSLNVSDSTKSITDFATKVAMLAVDFRGLPLPASVCVYPSQVDTVGLALGSSDVSITSVAAGFPSSQTFLEVKMLETAMAVENGADEVDVVISLGEFLEGDYDTMASEIEMLKTEVGEDITLKVIIESGELKSTEQIYNASILSMLAGADFIKTSTGKTQISATPEAVVVMCSAIKDFAAKTQKEVGIKIAGGVRTAQDAVLYYSIVSEILGDEYMDASLFRLGASSLANSLLTNIEGKEINYF